MRLRFIKISLSTRAGTPRIGLNSSDTIKNSDFPRTKFENHTTNPQQSNNLFEPSEESSIDQVNDRYHHNDNHSYFGRSGHNNNINHNNNPMNNQTQSYNQNQNSSIYGSRQTQILNTQNLAINNNLQLINQNPSYHNHQNPVTTQINTNFGTLVNQQNLRNNNNNDNSGPVQFTYRNFNNH